MNCKVKSILLVILSLISLMGTNIPHVLGEGNISLQTLDTNPISPKEAVLRYGGESPTSGTPILAWYATQFFEYVIILAAIFGTVTGVLLVVSKRKGKINQK